MNPTSALLTLGMLLQTTFFLLQHTAFTCNHYQGSSWSIYTGSDHFLDLALIISSFWLSIALFSQSFLNLVEYNGDLSVGQPGLQKT